MDSNFHSFYNTKCVQIKTDMNKIIILKYFNSCERRNKSHGVSNDTGKFLEVYCRSS